jgi:hypothetical protein
MNKKQLLYAAQSLAEFANLEAAKRNVFATKHADFLPSSWWTERVITNDAPPWAIEETWQYYRTVLRDAWREKFSIEKTVELVSAGRIPEKTIGRQFPLELLPRSEGDDKLLAQHGDQLREMVRQVDAAALRAEFWPRVSRRSWPYQMAVMFLASEPWRARFCQECGQRFVADKPKNSYCSVSCSGEARRASKRLSWEKHGKEWRPAKESKGKTAREKR